MTVFLQKGAHETLDAGGCAMEFVAWAAGEVHSDHPHCVSPVIAEFARSWNDGMNDADRQQLIPVLLDCIGTNTGPVDDLTRSWMCLDWLARVQTPAWLRLAGLQSHAATLEKMARVVDARTAGLAQPLLDAARAAAWAAARDAAWDAAGDAARDAALDAAGDAARDAAGDAAGAAARDAAWDAARDAAGDAAGAAARDAAWDAARAAAWAAARDAAWDAAGDAARDAALAALRPTVVALQVSALDLLRAMCAVGRSEVPVIEDRACTIRGAIPVAPLALESAR